MSQTTKTYQVIGMGGTFDHFHAGHAHFISEASQFAEKLLIGVSHPTLVGHKTFADQIEPLVTRIEAVKNFCQGRGITAEVFTLMDPFGPTLAGSLVEAVCVTTETIAGAAAINQARQNLNLPVLPVHVVKLLPDESGQDIHSARIRAGEINREGIVYRSILKSDFILSAAQKTFFTKAQGPVSVQPEAPLANELNLVVGDTTLAYFIERKWPHNLGVFDKRTQRQPVFPDILNNLEVTLNVSNPAGSISHELVTALQQSLAQPHSYIQVDGEEDLASVALFLLAPLGAKVWYGQPGEGIVTVTLTESFKDLVYQVLNSV